MNDETTNHHNVDDVSAEASVEVSKQLLQGLLSIDALANILQRTNNSQIITAALGCLNDVLQPLLKQCHSQHSTIFDKTSRVCYYTQAKLVTESMATLPGDAVTLDSLSAKLDAAKKVISEMQSVKVENEQTIEELRLRLHATEERVKELEEEERVQLDDARQDPPSSSRLSSGSDKIPDPSGSYQQQRLCLSSSELPTPREQMSDSKGAIIISKSDPPLVTEEEANTQPPSTNDESTDDERNPERHDPPVEEPTVLVVHAVIIRINGHPLMMILLPITMREMPNKILR